MRPRVAAFPILLVVALSLLAAIIACGGNDDTQPAAPGAGIPSPQLAPTPQATKVGGSMILATTTSTQDSGLLDVLVPRFKEETGIDVKVIAVGTGAALEMGAKGDADAVLVHAPASEKKYVDQGDLVQGKLVMHNDFIIVGPAADPAGARGLKDLNLVMAALAARGGFISRGDDSGTHTKELELWAAARIDPRTVRDRAETGQGMGATLNLANQRQAYTITDRATYLAQRHNLAGLQIVFEGAAPLLNVYHIYVVNPERHQRVKRAQSETFVTWLVSAPVQKRIGDFGKAEFGQPLFIADAGKREEDLALPAATATFAVTPGR